MQNVNPKKLRTRFYERSDMIWFIVLVGYPLVLIFITGGFCAFFTEVELEEGVPRIAAGSIMLILGLLGLLYIGYETYRLHIIRKYPLLVFYREGIQIREIGIGRPKRITKPHWENVILVVGQATNLIELIFRIENEEANDKTEENLASYQTVGVLYTSESFSGSLKKVVQSFDYYQNDPDARKSLPSWEGWDTVFFGHKLLAE